MAQENDIPPVPHPALNLPPSDSTVDVHMIDTTTKLVCPTEAFLQPPIKGQETLNFPTFSFLIENKKLGKTLLFDLGCRKDWWNLSPPALAALKRGIPGLSIEKNVNEILQEGGFDLNKVDAMVWSHWHFDHTGDPSQFPPKAELIVGPGFEKAFMPGYPANERSPVLETDFAGRNVREISFDEGLKIGKFPAHDFFGDGSFYLLDVPGHAVGHISGLARTTPSTFIFFGGDITHFGGAYRPTEYAPMPSMIPPATLLHDPFFHPCPCSVFTACHPNQSNPRTTPYYNITLAKDSWYVDPPAAQQSVSNLKEFDADKNVFVAIAHDVGFVGVLPLFPNGLLNDWQKREWRENTRWGWLNELPVGGKARPHLVEGLVRP